MSKLRRVLSRRASAVLCAAVVVTGMPMIATTAGATSPSPLHANGSINEAWLTGATPGDSLRLLKDASPVVGATGTADAQGALILRTLTPGTGYSFEDTTTSTTSTTFSVLAPGDNPSVNSTLYTDQSLHAGLNYVTMRDGVTIAATVRLPAGVTSLASGPFPTVIEYSGYATAGPHDPINCLVLKQRKACKDPLVPSSATVVGGLIARENGFATVSVQMRGSGCSGGAFDLFGYPSDYDGYDMIEVLAHQPWVAHHKVGMVGISYSGISQLEVAGTQPPGLAAIAPLSPTDDLFSTPRSPSPGPMPRSPQRPRSTASPIRPATPTRSSMVSPRAWRRSSDRDSPATQRCSISDPPPSGPRTSPCRPSSPAPCRMSRPDLSGRP